MPAVATSPDAVARYRAQQIARPDDACQPAQPVRPLRGGLLHALPAGDPRPPADADRTPAAPRWRLDAHERCLIGDDQRVPLSPRAFALLMHLIDRAQQIVSTAELLKSVWAGMVVEEGQVKQFVCALRALLGDDPAAPRHIQTVRAVGYRYLGGIQLATPSRPPLEVVPAPLTDASLEQMLQGRRSLCLLGAGPLKADQWLTAHTGGGAPLHDSWTLRLRCAAVCRDEPCSPMFDALDALCAGPDGDFVLQALSRWAPTWACEMPWRYDPADLADIRTRGAPGQQGRQRREFARLVEALAERRTLVLRVDNLHEADPALQRLLEYLAIQVLPARLLVLVTCAAPEHSAVLQRAAALFNGYQLLGAG